jgi:formate dehydrogenase iron-sulfur subunit
VWNCSYGAPQYNPERGVVGKCDMCHGRISRGQTPACVSACPEGAIEIELVDVASWRERRDGADGPGLPPSSDSVSTTRVTLPEAPGPLARVDLGRIRPQDPHWSLVFFLVFTQLAVGAVGALWLLEVTSASLPAWSALAPLIFAAFSLAAAPAHLGRPIYAYRAMRSWRRSWISREIIALSAFAAALGWYAASLWFGSPFSALAGGASLLFGVSGVVSSARIYMAPARPAWNMDFTQVEFLLTCAVLGPRLVLCMGLGGEPWLLALAAAATLLQIAVGVARLWKLSGSPAHELRGAATLALRGKRDVLLARLACAALSVALLPLEPVLGMLSALAGEVAARYLFFTAVVPKSIASTYLTPKGEAA